MAMPAFAPPERPPADAPAPASEELDVDAPETLVDVASDPPRPDALDSLEPESSGAPSGVSVAAAPDPEDVALESPAAGLVADAAYTEATPPVL